MKNIFKMKLVNLPLNRYTNNYFFELERTPKSVNKSCQCRYVCFQHQLWVYWLCSIFHALWKQFSVLWRYRGICFLLRFQIPNLSLLKAALKPPQQTTFPKGNTLFATFYYYVRTPNWKAIEEIISALRTHVANINRQMIEECSVDIIRAKKEKWFSVSSFLLSRLSHYRLANFNVSKRVCFRAVSQLLGMQWLLRRRDDWVFTGNSETLYLTQKLRLGEVFSVRKAMYL